MSESIGCPSCGCTVEVVGAAEAEAARVLYGPEAGALVPGARDFRIGDKAVLHHICSHPQVGEATNWERENAWWACQEPERKPDQHMKYDLHCAPCAERWIGSRVN
jgi:hypothetical protein